MTEILVLEYANNLRAARHVFQYMASHTSVVSDDCLIPMGLTLHAVAVTEVI